MKHNNFFCKFSLLGFLLYSSLFAQISEPFKVINPIQYQIAEEDTTSVVIETNSSLIDYFVISNDLNLSRRIDVDSNRSHYCEVIYLELGDNKIYIDGFKDGVLVKNKVQKVFHTSSAYKEYKYPPNKYDFNYFHNESKEKVCATCHNMSVNEVKGYAFEDVTKSNCYQCHSHIAEKDHGHAPAVNWLCTSCHNGEVGKFNRFEKGKTRFNVPDPIGTVCFNCHKKTKENWEKKLFQHEPVENGSCDRCHSSHSSKRASYLKKPVWDLCHTCHKIDGSHVIKTLFGKKHPTKGVKDPSRPGKELDCMSCHYSHASDNVSLLKGKSNFIMCIKCHKK